jgi:predicted amidohydrolase
MDITWEAKRFNFLRARGMLRGAGVAPGSLVLLPEMFATGFSMNVDGIAEAPGEETEAFLRDLAAELSCTVVGGIVRRGFEGKGRNCAVVAGSGGALLAEYAKLHPFSFGDEADHYAGGQKPVLLELADTRIGLSVCYDLRFPELYRRLAQAGAEVLLVIANWPVAREAHWVTLLQARAIENQCFVAGCNRVGRDPRNTYGGRSLIVGPRGEILADGAAWEHVVSADLQFATLRSWRETFPALRDIRPDLLP